MKDDTLQEFALSSGTLVNVEANAGNFDPLGEVNAALNSAQHFDFETALQTG